MIVGTLLLVAVAVWLAWQSTRDYARLTRDSKDAPTRPRDPYDIRGQLGFFRSYTALVLTPSADAEHERIRRRMSRRRRILLAWVLLAPLPASVLGSYIERLLN